MTQNTVLSLHALTVNIYAVYTLSAVLMTESYTTEGNPHL